MINITLDQESTIPAQDTGINKISLTASRLLTGAGMGFILGLFFFHSILSALIGMAIGMAGFFLFDFGHSDARS